MRTRILIVDDDFHRRAALCSLLAGQPFYVEAAVDGLDAVQRARLAWFDVVLMNAEIPEVDGVAAARLITDLTRDHGSPRIIALAAHPAQLLDGAADAARVFFAVVAPTCDPPVLLETIRRARRMAADGASADADGADRVAGGVPGCDAAAAWPLLPKGPASAEERRRTGRPRLLVADDDDASREMLASLLEGQGYEVEPAADGLAAVLMMGNAAYDAVLLDYDLPRLNGVAAARLAHDLLGRGDRPRLIALTAHPGVVQGRERACAPLFDDIIGKSLGFASVIGAVERCLSAPRMAQ